MLERHLPIRAFQEYKKPRTVDDLSELKMFIQKTIKQLEEESKDKLKTLLEIKSYSVYNSGKSFWVKVVAKEISKGLNDDDDAIVKKLALGKELTYRIEESSYDLSDPNTKAYWDSLDTLLKGKTIVATTTEYIPPREDQKQYRAKDQVEGTFASDYVRWPTI